MIEFLQRLFGKPSSSATAKERLRLVLMSDHLSLAPDMVDAMKRDLVEVISRYVQVDLSKIEVNFEQQDRALALLANIPIVSVNRGGGSDGNGTEENDAKAQGEQPTETAAALTEASAPAAPATPAQGSGSSKRRRKKSGGTTPSSRPATAN